ncbi:unnamed protein product [Tuber aestivum]|uniref:Transmembrane protein n=1 Tax=Tuber aestivum TaxID=59557 RepID=A0A292Q1R4_9PEZI|nr:unnamed protein product [Tuber aestivum]
MGLDMIWGVCRLRVVRQVPFRPHHHLFFLLFFPFPYSSFLSSFMITTVRCGIHLSFFSPASPLPGYFFLFSFFLCVERWDDWWVGLVPGRVFFWGVAIYLSSPRNAKWAMDGVVPVRWMDGWMMDGWMGERAWVRLMGARRGTGTRVHTRAIVLDRTVW